MFSLLLVLGGLVLIAAITLATMYYGGSSITRGQAAAEAATLMAQAAQIATASAAFTTDRNGVRPQQLQQLVEGQYLGSLPAGWEDPPSSDTLIVSKLIESENTCEAFNARMGLEGIPECASLETLSTAVCCQ